MFWKGFNAEAPAMISDVGTQIKDIQIRPYRGSKQSYLYEKGMGDDEDPRGCYASGGAGK